MAGAPTHVLTETDLLTETADAPHTAASPAAPQALHAWTPGIATRHGLPALSTKLRRVGWADEARGDGMCGVDSPLRGEL
jgi:hypothetical protein